MPNFNFNLQSTYNLPGMYGGVPNGYTRENKEYIARSIAGSIYTTVNPTSDDTILLVGAGFGWVAEYLIELGINKICAVDTSLWIQSQKSIEAVVDIHNLDVTSTQDQLTIKNLLGLSANEKIKYCITEDLFSVLNDAECIDISQNLRNIGDTVIHSIGTQEIKAPNSVLPFNWKTLNEWKQLLSPDLIIKSRSNIII